MGCVDGYGYWWPSWDQDEAAGSGADLRAQGVTIVDVGGGRAHGIRVVARGAPRGFGPSPVHPGGGVPLHPPVSGAVGPGGAAGFAHGGGAHGGGGGGGGKMGDMGKGAIVLLVLSYLIMPSVAIGWAATSPGGDESTTAVDDANTHLDHVRSGAVRCVEVVQ